MKSIYTSHFLMSRIKFAFLVLFAGLSGISQAQIAAWQFGTPASVGDELSYNATTVNQNVTVTALVRGSGISAYDLPNGFSSNTWNASSLANAITLNEYYEFKIQANEGFYVSLSSIDAILRRSPNGPRKYIWRYSVDGTTFSDISTYKSITSENENGVLQTQIDLTTIAELQNVQRVKTITLRLYAWDAITTSGTFAVGITPTGTSTNALTIGGTTGSAVSPVVSAQAVTNIINTTAIATGTVSTPGNPTPNEIGICWSTTIHPTTSNFKAISESGISTGSYKAYLKNLTPNTLYYVRAYVTTGSVTTYSQEELTFTSGNAVPTIAHAATKNFTNKHNILAAGFYRGRTYSLYTVDTNDNLNIDDINVSDNLVISQDTYSDVSSSLSYTSGSVVVRNDTLFAFYRDNVNNLVFVRSFLSDKNGKLVKTDNLSEFLMSHIVNVDLPNHPMEKYFGTLIAGTVFNNDIYLILRRDAADDSRLYLIKGTPISGPNYVSFNWQFVDVVKDGNGTEISVNPTFSNNTDSYDLVTMKCKNGADSLVVGRSNNNKITLHLFRGVNNWVTYEKPVSSDVSKCFRMIQGAFEGSGAIETKNTLQCIGKNTEIVLTEAFDIDERQFVGEQKLTLHDGNFATSISVLNANPEQTYYKQYINIITGDLSTYTDVDIYKSNTLFCSSKTSTDNKKIILTPSLRPLATLFGVIEGTPPTIFETEQDYVNNNWVSSAKLVKVDDKSTSNKVSQSFTGGGEVKLGNDFCSVAVEYKRSIERNKTKTVTVSNTMTCADKEIAHRDSATLLYAVPDIVFNSYYLCSPQSSLTTKVNVIDEPILNDITIRDAQNIVKINRSLKDAPFNITKPRDFTYWANRPMFQNFTPNSTNSLYASSDFDFSSIQINRKIEVETEIQTEKSNEVTVTVEAKFFSALDIKASSSYKITKSHTSTINESLELQLASLLRYKFPQYNSVSFKCNAMLLTKGNTQVENNYYPALRAAKFSTDANVCEAHENPWIIAYNITNMSVDRVPSGVELVNDENSGLSLKLYRQSPALVSLAINSNSDDLLTVELFTLNGQKIQTLLSKQPIAAGESTLTSECNVPSGLYIVKSYTSSGLKSGLVRL